MTFPILGGNGAVAGYSIDNSLRFEDGDSAYLTRTPSSAGNRKTWTWSAWIKRGNISTTQKLFMAYGGNNEGGYTSIDLDSNDTFRVTGYAAAIETTTALLRDVSAWYHLMVVFDTTQATEANRVKMYINGEQAATSQGGSHPDQNFEPAINNNVIHTIGARYLTSATGEFLDGYMAEVHFIDGTAKAPTDFGEFDSSSGIWKPKEYTGTYGTNGFYLDFENSGSLGADSSGNGNNFTPTNFSDTDQMTDTPTNNFPTLNSLNVVNGELKQGNLYYTNGANWFNGVTGTQSFSAGKWYWEVRPTGSYWFIGIQDVDSEQTANSANGAYKWTYAQNAKKYNNTTYVDYGATYASTDIIGVAYDADNGTLTFYKNGSSQGVAYSGLDTSKRYAPFVNSYGSAMALNFGQDGDFAGTVTAQGNADGNGYGDFYYAPPSGYLALCTQNLATELSPTIDDGSEYFNTVLYTGNGSSQSITGVGFSPDFLWLKERSSTSHHQLFHDADGGVPKFMQSSSTIAEVQNSAVVSSFDSDGFSVGSSGGSNQSGETYVGWNWYTGASYGSNTDGDITSTVSANTTAGFSIGTYTGDGDNTHSVGHGLGGTPAWIIVKRREGNHSWIVWHQNLTATSAYALDLENTDAEANNTSYFYDTAPDANTFHPGNGGATNGSGGTYVFYAFKEIEGYSKFGSYTGNGSTDGAYINLGFKPKFLLQRRTNASGQGWTIQNPDNQSYNEINNYFFAQHSGSTFTGYAQIDFLSNGFKIRTADAQTNGSGDTYIYMAFAEHPFVSSKGAPVTAR